MGKIGKTGRSDSRTPFRIHFCKRKTARGMPKQPILDFSQGGKVHWFLGPNFTEANAGISEIGAARGNQGPTQPCLAHRAAVNIKQERADPLTQIGPSLEINS